MERRQYVSFLFDLASSVCLPAPAIPLTCFLLCPIVQDGFVANDNLPEDDVDLPAQNEDLSKRLLRGVKEGWCFPVLAENLGG